MPPFTYGAAFRAQSLPLRRTSERLVGFRGAFTVSSLSSVICHLSSWPVSRLRISLLCLDRDYWQQYGRHAVRRCFCKSLSLDRVRRTFLPVQKGQKFWPRLRVQCLSLNLGFRP